MMVGANQPGKRILEVGCGSGFGIEIIATSILSKDGKSVVVGCDFSDNMVKQFKQRMSKSDYASIEGNLYDIDSDTDFVSNQKTIDLDSVIDA